MAVQVDQPRQDHVLVQVDGFPGAELLVCFALGQDIGNTAALKDNSLVFQNHAKGFHGYQPARVDPGVGRSNGVCRH